MKERAGAPLSHFRLDKPVLAPRLQISVPPYARALSENPRRKGSSGRFRNGLRGAISGAGIGKAFLEMRGSDRRSMGAPFRHMRANPVADRVRPFRHMRRPGHSRGIAAFRFMRGRRPPKARQPSIGPWQWPLTVFGSGDGCSSCIGGVERFQISG